MSDNLLSQEEIDALLGGGVSASPEPPAAPPSFGPPPSFGGGAGPDDQTLVQKFVDAIVDSESRVMNAILLQGVEQGSGSLRKISANQFSQENQGRQDYAIDVTFKEGLNGKIYFLLEKELGLLIGDLMVGNDGSDLPRKMDEVYESAVIESINQIMGNACSNLAELFNANVDFDSPMVTEISYDTGIEIDIGDEIMEYAYDLAIKGFPPLRHTVAIPATFANDMAMLLRSQDGSMGGEVDFAQLLQAQTSMAEPKLVDESLFEMPSAPASEPPFQAFQQPEPQPVFHQPEPQPAFQPPPQQPEPQPAFQPPPPQPQAPPQQQFAGFQQQPPQAPQQQQFGGFQQQPQMPMGGFPGYQGYPQQFQGMPPQAPPQQGGFFGGNFGPPPGNPAVQQARFDNISKSSEAGGAANNLEILLDVPLQVTVELGRTSRTVREVLELGAGSVVELDKLAGESVELLVNNKLIAKGEVVVIDENFGIRITSIVSPKERLESLK